MTGIEACVGVVILILLVAGPILSMSRLFKRQKLIAQWHTLFHTWKKAFSAWNDDSQWKLIAGGLGKGLPALEGLVKDHSLIITPTSISADALSICLTYPLKRQVSAKISIQPEKLTPKVKKLFSGKPEIGDPDFDDTFWIVSSVKQTALVNLVSSELRTALVNFHKSRNSWILFHLSDSTLIFEERGGPLRPHGYPELMNALANLAIHLECQEELFDGGGNFLMEILSQGNLTEGATCQICGGPLGRAVVACKACGTHHHPDCWEYNGSCAIFGCGCTTCKKVGESE